MREDCGESEEFKVHSRRASSRTEFEDSQIGNWILESGDPPPAFFGSMSKERGYGRDRAEVWEDIGRQRSHPVSSPGLLQ